MTPNDQQQQIQSVGAEQVREQDKIQLVLSYFGILALIPFLTVKDSPYVQYHAKQGLVLFGAAIVISFLNIIPVLGTIVYCVGMLGYFVVSIMGIMKALKGERWQIPVISDLATKF